jgi:hypothetical protein
MRLSSTLDPTVFRVEPCSINSTANVVPLLARDQVQSGRAVHELAAMSSIHSLSKTPPSFHSWNRRWAVLDAHKHRGKAFH